MPYSNLLSLVLQIIESHPEMQLYFGLDVDPVAFEFGRSRIHSVLQTQNSGTNTASRSQLLKVYTHLRNFKHIKSVISTAALQDHGYLLDKGVDGVLMDLGMSSMQVSRLHLVAISQLQCTVLSCKSDFYTIFFFRNAI